LWLPGPYGGADDRAGCSLSVEKARQLVRRHDHAVLDEWLASAERSGIPEFHGFAHGLRRDLDAVTAALKWSWSNGQTEGHVNRLKTLKRAMYGRAKLDLLRLRLLYAA
jgi:transposase